MGLCLFAIHKVGSLDQLHVKTRSQYKMHVLVKLLVLSLRTFLWCLQGGCEDDQKNAYAAEILWVWSCSFVTTFTSAAYLKRVT